MKKNDDLCNVPNDDAYLLYHEWLFTNGLGGYSCGTLSGTPTRKYHSYLTSALKNPFGRTVMLNYIADSIIIAEQEFPISQLSFKNKPLDTLALKCEFRLEENMPIWRYQFENTILEKRIWMAHSQNTTYIEYELIESTEIVSLKMRPFLQYRTTENDVYTELENNYEIHTDMQGIEILKLPFPGLKLINTHSVFTIDLQIVENIYYEIEEKRGYESVGSLTSPGFFLAPLNIRENMTFIASTEDWTTAKAMSAKEAKTAEKQRIKSILKEAEPLSFSKTAARLIIAADQFIITPKSRELDIVKLTAMGENVCSVIAGYPWFTDWGRDTMISLEGLTLTTGRPHIAKSILRTFALYIHKGLIPNMFPDGENLGLYHTADATLWFFHAVDRYITLTGDRDFLDFMLPKFKVIIESHIKGTLFGIKADVDGLLIQGEDHYQLTWMDAKVDDWVVTPRRGKAVEINALWYNALRLLDEWSGTESDLAKQCYKSFNEVFWNEKEGYLYDVISDGIKDSSLRPNQIFAISLKYPVLDPAHWKSVIDIVKKELVKPKGLRTLSANHIDYKALYEGNLLNRDSAYHQGTIWPWLIGSFIDAWLKVYPDIEEAKKILMPLDSHIYEDCIGTISEIFDAEDPFHAKGCFAQAWSVAEYLRIYAKLNFKM